MSLGGRATWGRGQEMEFGTNRPDSWRKSPFWENFSTIMEGFSVVGEFLHFGSKSPFPETFSTFPNDRTQDDSLQRMDGGGGVVGVKTCKQFFPAQA